MHRTHSGVVAVVAAACDIVAVLPLVAVQHQLAHRQVAHRLAQTRVTGAAIVPSCDTGAGGDDGIAKI
jgi:hypothetical protein